jgi:hypothetical protein
MSLQALLNNQTIEIDDHKRGVREIKNWDDPNADIHIDKKTNYKIDGVLQEIRIKISINSLKPIISFKSKKKEVEIPEKLKKEIKKAFMDIEKRSRFVNDLIKILKDYKSIFENEAKVIQALNMISLHFDLMWSNKIITKMVHDNTTSYTGIYNDISGKQYFITLEKHKIVLGDIDTKNRKSFL